MLSSRCVTLAVEDLVCGLVVARDVMDPDSGAVLLQRGVTVTDQTRQRLIDRGVQELRVFPAMERLTGPALEEFLETLLADPALHEDPACENVALRFCDLFRAYHERTAHES